MTALKRIGLCILWLTVFLIFSACCAAGALAPQRLYGIGGSILGLIPASLHFRNSQTQTPPRRIWRVLSVLVITAFGSLSFLAYIPCVKWHSPLPFKSRAWLRVVDTISCVSISVVAAVGVSMRHPPSTYIRHAIWSIWGIWMLVLGLMLTNVLEPQYDPITIFFARHLEATVFRWCAWLMLSRTTALLPQAPSFVITHSSTFVNLATLCFHIKIAIETLFGNTLESIACQLTLAGTFVLLWMLVCMSIASCLQNSRQKLHKEAEMVTGAPRAEALWAKSVLSVELGACLAIAFSCTAFTWIPYKVMWILDREVAEDYFSVPLVIGQRCDMLIKTLSVATLSGLLWTPSAPNVQREASRVQTMSIPPGADAKIWAAQVKVLANRGFTLSSLLSFWRSLGSVMPSFDPQRSTTNDVVRMAIIPLSRHQGGGQALASIWSKGAPVPAKCMVTHNWSNLFLHLVAGILADALGKEYYAGIAEKLLTKHGIRELEASIQEQDVSCLTYWVCAFSINQHGCICNSFGNPPVDQEDFQEWDEKRHDTVTGKVLPLCDCKERKVFSTEPNTCELNKFHWMMRHLGKEHQGFSHLVVADAKFEVFTRAWCIAEIVESEASCIPKRIMTHSETAVDDKYNSLVCIDVRDCRASRSEDREMILAHIMDVDSFNLQLQLAIFGTEGLLSEWVDGPGRTSLVARILRRIDGCTASQMV